ncbi:hypothetical protein QUF80_23895 [Desulfococcaceae bacterium HSG8]|nr:hypothetical protein [Desulfococcaceae bacterium HSG8]
MMNTLIIRHITGTDPASFELMRLSDGKRTSKPVEIPSPVGFPVEGHPDSELMTELRWYMKKFLDYPFSPYTDVADRVWDALRRSTRIMVKQGFGALFFGTRICTDLHGSFLSTRIMGKQGFGALSLSNPCLPIIRVDRDKQGFGALFFGTRICTDLHGSFLSTRIMVKQGLRALLFT